MSNNTIEYIGEIVRPSDFHHHFREGNNWLSTTVPLCFDRFEYAVAMPNLEKPIQTYKSALDYQKSIINIYRTAKPLMTYYLNANLGIQEIETANENNKTNIIGAKYYPRGATTNSNYGLTGFKQVREQLSALENAKMRLLIHGEDPYAPVLLREEEFIKSGEIRYLLEEFPDLKITLEHISSEYTVNYLRDIININKTPRIAATITPHHLKYTINDIFKDGINPLLYCCPILKSPNDRLALQELATSGMSNIFLGTDNAPHTDENKLKINGKAGVFNIYSAISDTIDTFIGSDKLYNLERFISINGCDWYSLPLPEKKVKIYTQNNTEFTYLADNIIPRSVHLSSGCSITPINYSTNLKYIIE